MITLFSSARPSGYAPRGTSLGLAGLLVMGPALPFLILQSLVTVLAGGLDLWIGSLLWVLGVGFLIILVTALNLHRRRLWFMWFVFGLGCVVMTTYALGVILSLAILFGLVPLHSPELRFLIFVNIFMWIAALPFAIFLLRFLRLRYWQPWTTPEQWERGDETPPSWAPGARTRLPK